MKKVWLILIVNIVLGLGQFWLLSLISTDGEEIWQQVQAQKIIQSQNQILKQKIFSISSLPEVKLRAEKMNFIPLKTDFWRSAVVAQVKP